MTSTRYTIPDAPAPPRWDAEPAGALPATLDTLEDLRLAGADLAGVRARGITLRDCELRDPSLANLAGREGRMLRTLVTGSRATGLDWSEGSLQDVVFRDCHLGLASFHFAGLQRVVFERCVLTEADFGETRCESVRFADCDLTRASFEKASFRRSELRGCTLEELQGVAGLRGAALGWSDVVALAPTFAEALGIRTHGE
jgi:uncharacterized protein YjbI with pentapeptide repeats